MEYQVDIGQAIETQGISAINNQVMTQKDNAMDTDQQSTVSDRNYRRLYRFWRYLLDISPRQTMSQGNIPLAVSVERPYKKKPKSKPLSRRLSI